MEQKRESSRADRPATRYLLIGTLTNLGAEQEGRGCSNDTVSKSKLLQTAKEVLLTASSR